MDYSGIINLVLVTIIYSTFIGPNLKRMSDIRSEISDLDFPPRPGSPNTSSEEAEPYNEKIRENVETLRKKFSQYGLIFRETRLFIIIFYITLGFVFGVQVWLMGSKETLTFESGLYLGIAVVVIILLAISLRIFMVPYNKIRTIKWLYEVGIPEVHTFDMYNPRLWIGHRSLNIKNDSIVRFQLASKIRLYENRIIFTVESPDGKSMFALAAGRISSRASGGTSDFMSGERYHLVEIINRLKLKPGEYKARFLVFGSVYSGVNHPTQIIKPFKIGEGGAELAVEEIDLSQTTADVSYTASNRPKITSIDFTNDLKKSDRFKELLATRQFVNTVSKSRHLMQLVDSHGTLAKHIFEKKFTRRHLMRKGLLRFVGNHLWRRKKKHSNTCL